MTYNPDIHNRKSIRLKNYDYSKEGLYFITICSHNKECIFGEIIEEDVGAHCMCPKNKPKTTGGIKYETSEKQNYIDFVGIYNDILNDRMQ